MLQDERGVRPIFVAGRWVTEGTELVVQNPADPRHPAGVTVLAGAAEYEAAVDGAVRAFVDGRDRA
ncbi:MAG: hypothetical protein ACRDGI_06315, partial [Candidatus Limnocylindrales bacterium]